MCLLNAGVLQKRKWENAMTIDGEAWTYRRDAKLSDFLSPEKLVATLVETVRYMLLLFCRAKPKGSNCFI